MKVDNMALYPTKLARATVGRKLVSSAALRESSFTSPPSLHDRNSAQLAAFNRVWNEAVSTNRFYSEWKSKHGLPTQLESLSELLLFPQLTKAEINKSTASVFGDSSLSAVYQTSGSTGEPTRFPAAPYEHSERVADIWHYRREFGLSPLDRYLYVGSIQTPSGSWANWQARRLATGLRRAAANSREISGYLLDEQSGNEACTYIARFRPKYLVGFPSAIANIARAASLREHPLQSVETIILSSEIVEDSDLLDIESGFPLAKIAIEYGSEEIGVIAASHRSPWPLRTAWNAVHLSCDDEYNVLATTLTRRRFPLINYRLGDRVEPDEVLEGSIHSLARVWGREQDILSLPLKGGGQRTINAMGMIRILRFIEGVTSTQFFQDGRHVHLFVVHDESGSDERTLARARASLNEQYSDVDLAEIHLARLDAPVRTTRLKRRVVLDEYPRNLASQSVRISDK